MTKLEKLCEIEGMTEEELFEASLFGDSCMGICMNEGCDYTTEVEPDQTKGWCDECQTNSIKSGLILGGII